MGCSIQFVRLDDFINDIDVLDFSTAGYSLAVDGYFPVAAPLGAKSVHEVITLKLQGTSKDDLAAMTQEIDEKIKQVQWWIEAPKVERYQVWIRVQLENETYPRQAQILNIQPPDKVRIFTPEERVDNYIGSYTIGIERTPLWEDPYPYPTTTAMNNISECGGVATLSETINGEVPARAAIISIAPITNKFIGEFWLGVKSNRFGTPANFVPRWDLYLSEYRGADTTIVADATTVNGVSKLRVTFGTPTLVNRSITLVSDVAASNPNDQRGTYLVLLRAKMSDTSIARVKMSYSFGRGSLLFGPVARSPEVIRGTSWRLYSLGTAALPALRITPSLGLLNAGIALDAELSSGAGSLDLDCLILIPVDDGALHVESSARVNVVSTEHINVLQAADGSLRTFTDSLTNQVYFPTSVSPINWEGIFSSGTSPTLVFAGQNYAVFPDSVNSTADAVNITYTYIPRWRTLRGNST